MTKPAPKISALPRDKGALIEWVARVEQRLTRLEKLVEGRKKGKSNGK